MNVCAGGQKERDVDEDRQRKIERAQQDSTKDKPLIRIIERG